MSAPNEGMDTGDLLSVKGFVMICRIHRSNDLTCHEMRDMLELKSVLLPMDGAK